jgi:monoterpene epsilon-lactone hydrolase
MTISSAERRARAALPVARFMQVSMPLPAANWLLKHSLTRLRLADGLAREPVSADGVACVWLIPPNSPTEQVLLYLHGGGFVFGLTPPHLQMGAYLAQMMGLRVLMVDYRLAPRHPFPAALDDCATAYRWLLKQGVAAQNSVIAGDSAGGNLVLTLLMKLRDSGDPLPAAAACLSPVTDLTQNRADQGIKDPLLPPKAMRLYTTAYVGEHDPHDPLISPVFGQWRGLPPLLVHAGEDEILRADAVRAEALAKAAGVDVRLEIYPRMWHVWQLHLALPQAVQSLGEIAHFLGSHLPGGSAPRTVASI